MSLASIVAEQVIIVLIILFIGVICYKVKLIDEKTNEKLTNILLMLVTPILIIVSYQREFSGELVRGLLTSFVLAIITHLLGIVISYLLFRKKKLARVNINEIKTLSRVDNPDVAVERMSAIYSNCGFMGIPLINGVFGSEGVFYTTAYITIFNILIWTHGIIMMDRTDKGNKLSLLDILKKLASPTIISIIIGLLLFIFQIKLPKVIYSSFDHIASLNTPLAMLVAGATIAQTSIISVFKNHRIYILSFVRLLLIPILSLIIYSRFPINNTVLLTNIILTASPVATTVVMFSVRYKRDHIYASEIFAVTTILSSITIPLVLTIAEKLI